MAGQLTLHQHGKSKVRVGRVWREGATHHFVEWNVFTMVESDMEKAFTDGDNTGMTATDTQKNTVYVVAQRMTQRCSPETYATALAKHFVDTYPRISKAKVYVEQKAWTRVAIDGKPHAHGFGLGGTEIRTANAVHCKKGILEVSGGVKELTLCKTTQSGYSGFLHDRYTLLPDVNDRIMASSVTATWRYTAPPPCYDAAFAAAKAALLAAFFGPADKGIFSPSVQFTLHDMACRALSAVPAIESVYLNMPNLHFIPIAPVGSKFDNDVYVATSEPHGNIEAVVTRKGAAPHCRL